MHTCPLITVSSTINIYFLDHILLLRHSTIKSMKIITFIIFYSFFSSQVWAISKCPPWEEYQNYFKNAKYRPYRIDALKAKGIFIIAHGLNNTSDSMRPLQIELAKLGYSSVSLSLKGHRG